MRASHPEIVAGIERGLLGEALHQVVHAADAGCVLLHFVDLIERELILDRSLFLDGALAKFRLLAAVRVLRVFVVGVLAIDPSRRRWSKRQRARTPVVGPSLLWSRRHRRRHDPFLKPFILVVARLPR